MGSPCCPTETRRKATRPLYVPSPMQPRLWLLLATSVSCATPRTPIAENARCEGCHESEAREWRSSLHRASHEDPTYRASFRREPQAFCTQCHAPLGLESASIGVGCTSCHGKDHESGKLAEATCVGCHEFSFPDRARSTAAEDRMQLTATEHTDSAFANASCSSCHMPSSGARKTITDVSLPSPRAQADYARTPAIDGIGVGAPWAALMDGTVVRFKDGHWTPVPVPKAPFAFPGAKFNVPHAEGVRVLAADDAWVNVKYMEWPSHDSDNTREERRAFLRTLPPKETLRCTRDGFVSFPPLASPDCKTPLVIMATTPSTNSTDWPQSRKLLASSRLEGVSLIEFTAENKKILAAKVPSYDTGKKLLMALHEDNVFAAPETVCAAPDNTRAVPLQDADASH